MKLAIHHIESGTFSERWIDYCIQREIPYKPVNCYDSDIIAQINDCDALLWHHNHVLPKDVLFARQLLVSVESSGKSVFPDYRTGWHFDDKLGQKYLMEALNLPLVPSYSFYSKPDAITWFKTTSFPKVFKLRGGAGSKNVMLVRNMHEALSIADKAFGRGFRQYNAFTAIREQVRKFRLGKAGMTDIIKAMAHIVYPLKVEQAKGREKGYVYFQDFMPDNLFDIRVIVIGNKAFAIKRMVRQNDFRASGSGHILYKKEDIDERCVSLAFLSNQKIRSQCIAFDFVFDQNNNPLIVEISYGFMAKGYDPCPGYWDKEMNWHEGKFNPYGWMIDHLIETIGAETR
ncbi:MAG: hypothetical protein FD166_2644 [Bacteroidetes bacterium]|nr:MAG: hypothetical protein FD166_2644 [Bacteroidota bacterium]